MSGINQVMGRKEWVLLVFLSIIWGASFFFVEVAVKQMTPFTIVFCRVGLAAVILSGVALATGRRLSECKGIWLPLLLIGALNNAIPFSLIAWGQKHIDSSLASILTATTPVFSVVLAHFLTRDEQLTQKRLIGVLSGFLGVVVLVGMDSLEGIGIKSAGQIAVLGAAICYTFAAIYGRRFKDMDPVVVSAGMLTGATLIMLPVAFVFENPFFLQQDWTTWSALFGLSALSTALAYIIYFYILGTSGATNILLVTFLIPVSTIILGMAVLGERPGWNVFAGMFMIFLGLFFIDGRLFHRKK